MRTDEPTQPPAGEASTWPGEWVDTDAPDRWRPPIEERLRAGLILVAVFAVLAFLALAIPSRGGDDVATGDDPAPAASGTAAEPEVTTPEPPTTEPAPEPASVGGVAPPERCAADDRGGRDLRPRAELTAVVMNATSRTGHAGDITARLDDVGYDTATPGNAGREPVTIVWYPEGSCAEADRLTGDLDLPQAEVRELPRNREKELGGADLLVIAGADSL